MKHSLVMDNLDNVDMNEPVKVYRNLNSKCLSIQQDGLVVAHVLRVNLKSVRFVVSEAGRLRCLREKRKNVHAFVIGTLSGPNFAADVPGLYQPVGYNPYKFDSFVTLDDELPVSTADFVTLSLRGGMAYNPE